MSRKAVWPASGTSCGLGSLIVPSKVGEASEVMLSPTMFVSLAGSSLNEPARTDGGVVLMMKESIEIAAGIPIAGGECQLSTRRDAADRVLAVECHALGAGEHRRSAAEQGDLVGIRAECQAAGAQVDGQDVLRCSRGAERGAVGELAGQVDVLVQRLAGIAAQVHELDRVRVHRVGVERAIEVDVDLPGSRVGSRDPTHGVELLIRRPRGRNLPDISDFRRMQVHILVGPDVHERVAAVTGARITRLRSADVSQDVALARDRLVVVPPGEGGGAGIASVFAAVGLVARTGCPLVGEAEVTRPG